MVRRLRFNYGASIHRVVGLDLADAVFEPGHDRHPPAVEAAGIDAAARRAREIARDAAPLLRRRRRGRERLVDRRLDAVEKEITEGLEGAGRLSAHDRARDVFWRRGASDGNRPLDEVGTRQPHRSPGPLRILFRWPPRQGLVATQVEPG